MQERLRVCKIAVATDASGNASAESDKLVIGEILKLVFLKGTVNATTTAVVTISDPLAEQVDSYNVNTGSAARYPRTAVLGSAAGDNKWCPFACASTITVAVSGGAASKAFTVYVYYR